MKNKSLKRLVLVLTVGILLGLVAGCSETEVPEAEVEMSEVVEESISDALSEEVSEIVSEDILLEETVEEVEIVKYSNADELLEYVSSLNKTVIVEYNFGEEGGFQAIIPNGEKYTMQMGNILRVIPDKEVLQIESNEEYIDIMEPVRPNVWGIVINTTGSDIEISCTIQYLDGTEEDIIIYVTNE